MSVMEQKEERDDIMHEIHELISNSQLVMIEKAGHALFIDQPEQFNHVVHEFIMSQI